MIISQKIENILNGIFLKLTCTKEEEEKIRNDLSKIVGAHLTHELWEKIPQEKRTEIETILHTDSLIQEEKNVLLKNFFSTLYTPAEIEAYTESSWIKVLEEYEKEVVN